LFLTPLYLWLVHSKASFQCIEKPLVCLKGRLKSGRVDRCGFEIEPLKKEYRMDPINVETTTRAEKVFVHWPVIFAGLFIALLAHIALTALGMGIGGLAFGNVLIGDNGTGLGIFALIWMVVSAAVALFIGAFLAIRMSNSISHSLGAAEGLVIASAFFIAMAISVTFGLGVVAPGVGAAVGQAGTGAGQLAQHPVVQGVVDRTLGELELRAPVEEVAQGIATRVLAGDIDGARAYLARQSDLSEPEINDAFRDLRTAVQEAEEAVGSTIAAFGWTLLVTILLGGGGAAFGGRVAASRNLKQPITGDVSGLRR